ncbi:MAG: peptidylprolyl isomerase [Thermoanaerobaculia bacterium]|nr:peptidylprolyl isomerase [Thermoanaerobaculia bacterium]
MKKTIVITMLVCLSSVGVSAQDESEVVVESGDITLTVAELESAIATLPDEYRAYAAGPGKKSFAEDLLRMKRLAQAAEESGVADDPMVEAQVELARVNTLANAQVEQMRESIEVDPERVESLYEERKNQFERAKARHILIAFEGSPAAGEDAPTEEEAKAEAEAIRERIEGGADFAEIAKAESDDQGSGARGGELGEFSRGQMVPEFENAVFTAGEGELTPVVRTQFGYHVIQVQERDVMTLEEVREQLATELRQQKLQEQIESFGEGTETTFDESYFQTSTPAESAVPEGS